MPVSTYRLSDSQRAFLDKIGLSPDEITTYERAINSSCTAQDMGETLKTHASAVYRLFYSLENRGLVRKLGGRPMRYVGVKPELVFPALCVKETHDTQLLLEAAIVGNNGSIANVDEQAILFGREALYERYVYEAASAQSEILAYTIGIAYSDQLYNAQKSAISRGVEILHVVQKYKPSNLHIITKWQRLGVKLKKLPGNPGFHLMVFDRRQVIISFSNPSDTDDRLSIVSDNASAAQHFVTQFLSIWQKAQPIE